MTVGAGEAAKGPAEGIPGIYMNVAVLMPHEDGNIHISIADWAAGHDSWRGSPRPRAVEVPMFFPVAASPVHRDRASAARAAGAAE
ncbi:hypothetical protein GCM10010302_19700 [Streptomyces polychromogenes]|uniref:Uncharacterized protein n=1 Tax=Streptomyces polychromogenes TaxID=67342 RepID=A0ABN0V9N9_9ACTN